MSRLLPFDGKVPRVASDAFVAPGATLIGDVTVESGASVWFGAILRGDNPEQGIVVGEGANIQDNAVVHVGDWAPTVVEAGVTVGHGAVFESCTIGEGSLVGMNAVILPESEVGPESLVAAGCVLLEGTQIPPRSVVAGVPGKVRKSLDGSAAEWVRRSGHHYWELSRKYLQQGFGRGGPEAPLGTDGSPANPAEHGQAPTDIPADPSGATSICEQCGESILERHCKLVCPNCGFQRDCSDP